MPKNDLILGEPRSIRFYEDHLGVLLKTGRFKNVGELVRNLVEKEVSGAAASTENDLPNNEGEIANPLGYNFNKSFTDDDQILLHVEDMLRFSYQNDHQRVLSERVRNWKSTMVVVGVAQTHPSKWAPNESNQIWLSRFVRVAGGFSHRGDKACERPSHLGPEYAPFTILGVPAHAIDFKPIYCVTEKFALLVPDMVHRMKSIGRFYADTGKPDCFYSAYHYSFLRMAESAVIDFTPMFLNQEPRPIEHGEISSLLDTPR